MFGTPTTTSLSRHGAAASVPVEADTGAIGGNFSHEFMVLAETGEDTIASCTGWPECDWAANVERAARPHRPPRHVTPRPAPPSRK